MATRDPTPPANPRPDAATKPVAERRSRKADHADRTAAPGADVDLTSAAAASSAPAMPHERDEATGMTGGVPSERVQQGAKDLDRGLQDTSRSPEADRAYTKLKKSR